MAPSAHQGWDPDRLRRHRERHGLTLDQVADAVRNLALDGFTPPNATFQTVGRHERGESYPGPRYQRAYCELYGVNEVTLGFRAALPSERGVDPGTGAASRSGRRSRKTLDVAQLASLASRGEFEPYESLDVLDGILAGDGGMLDQAGHGRPVFGGGTSLARTGTRPPFGRDDTGAGSDRADHRPEATRAPLGAQEAAARALMSERLRGPSSRATAADAPLADALSVILAAQREVEDTIGSAPLLGPVTAQLAALMPLVFEARGAARRAMVDVAAQWAQFAGWLHANTGATAQARVWLDRAAEWAAEAGNPSLTANILSYKGHLAWESRAVGPLIGLSQAAQRVPDIYPGQLAYDASQEARGHAMAGDADLTDRKLAAARALWEEASEFPDGPPPWSYYFSPAFAQLQEGLAHRYLARHDPRRARLAVEDLTMGLDGLPEKQRNAEWAAEFVYHLAVAHIHTAEPEAACADTLTAAAIARATGSRRVTNQVRGLHNRIAERWPTLPAVVELTERLHDPEPVR